MQDIFHELAVKVFENKRNSELIYSYSLLLLFLMLVTIDLYYSQLQLGRFSVWPIAHWHTYAIFVSPVIKAVISLWPITN